jgi:hypothetical protein
MSADSNPNRAALTPRPPGGRTGRTGKGLGPVTHGDVYVSRGWRGRGFSPHGHLEKARSLSAVRRSPSRRVKFPGY